MIKFDRVRPGFNSHSPRFIGVTADQVYSPGPGHYSPVLVEKAQLKSSRMYLTLNF